MANIRKDTVVLDNAAGTGGFLVAAMGEMMNDAGDDESKHNAIRENQIYGIERLLHKSYSSYPQVNISPQNQA